MTPEQWQQLLSTLGDAESQVYAAAARQAQLDATAATAFLLLFIFCATDSIAMTIYSYRADNGNEIVWIAILFISFLFIVLISGTVFTYFTNPQWAIYETIVGLMQ